MELTKGTKTLKIMQDDCDMNPRTEWDNLGTMICFHKRYSLGDKHNFTLEDAMLFEQNRKDCIIMPMYMYDHSGITIATKPFSCPWDSGKIGFIYITKKKAREEYGWKVITKARELQIRGYLENEVNTYDQFLRGEVYRYEVYEGEEMIDSCGGFFGSDHKESGLYENAGWKV